MLEPVPLDRAEVVAIAEIHEQLLLDGPVAVPARRPVLALEVLVDVAADPVVVEERVVDVDEKDNRMLPHAI